jgi:3'-phosphoadenosine 5'-phosphosulfate sulfotransferase (PAPS reductase)/FAD synthetase
LSNRFARYIREKNVQNILSFSGGKDSTACYLLAIKQGLCFRAIFADTGHEHEWTIDYIHSLHEKTGGPEIEIIKADFSGQLKRKRQIIKEKWSFDGVPQERIKRALELLKPTGIPMLDLCMLKGRFPSAKARFCTEELKSLPLTFQVIFPALKTGPVVSWQGIRAQESKSRANMPRIAREESGAITWRPIFNWTHDNVFALHKEMGVAPNPLYTVGMGRVGCLPCIMCQKSEIKIIAQRFPEHIERLAEWEKIIAAVSKRGQATFFAADTAPFPAGYDPAINGYYDIQKIVEWSKTTRGGRKYDLFETQEPPLCSSKYGLCE